MILKPCSAFCRLNPVLAPRSDSATVEFTQECRQVATLRPHEPCWQGPAMVALNRSRVGLGLTLLATFFVASCGGGGGRGAGAGNGGGGQVPPPTAPTPPQPNRAPVAANDALRADSAILNAIPILANDTDPDGDALTVTIDDKPPIGTVTVN